MGSENGTKSAIDHALVGHWCRIIGKAYRAWQAENPWVAPPQEDSYLVLFVLSALRDERTPCVDRLRELLITDVCPCESCDDAAKIVKDTWDANPTAADIAKLIAGDADETVSAVLAGTIIDPAQGKSG